MKRSHYILGMHKAFVDVGLLPSGVSFNKIAAAADAAAQATPQEFQTVGDYITPNDLDSLAKILDILGQLLQMYQQQSGGGAPPQQGGMPPDQMGGMPPQGMPPQGMPPQGMPPQGMPPQQAGGMPPQGMPPPM
jgi:hypothetical protein